MKKNKPPIPNIIRPRDELSATITKLSHKQTNNREVELNYVNTTAVANSTYEKISSNDEILTLFPDVEISIQILVSSILAPNDLISTKLSYNADNIDIPNNVNALITDVIKTYINTNYKLEDKLSTILREALFTKGGYAEIIIPDTVVHDIQKRADKVTLSTESFITNIISNGSDKTVGICSTIPNTVLSVESLSTGNIRTTNIDFTDDDLGLDFTDNCGILTAHMSKLSGLSKEAMHVSTSRKPNFKSFMQKKKVAGDSVINIVPDNTNGSPMAMKLPIGSVLPIHLGNDPSNHIGYFVVLDENGLPVSGSKAISKINEVSSDNLDKLDNKASIIKKASTALKSKLTDGVTLEGVSEIYSKALIARINDRMASSSFGSIASVSEKSEVYQLIAARAFKGLQTRLLYVPKDNLTYFAFEYRENGTGKSLLEKSVMLFSIRAANVFTRIMANIKNSITTTKVTGTLDPADMDPEYSREVIINETLKSERAKYPIGTTKVADLVDWMHNVGYRFDIKHPSLPEVDISIEDDSRSLVEPDTDLDEMIQEHIIMSFGLKKDMVMAGYDAEFATTVVANNILFAKRVMELQTRFNTMLSEYASKVLRNDGCLKESIVSSIHDNISGVRRLIKKSLSKDEYEMYKESIDNDDALIEYVYGCYITDIKVTLPKVELSGEEGTLDGLDAFVNMLDTYLPMIISSETLPIDLVGDLSDKMDDITFAIKTVLIKNWVDDRNFLPEITKFLTLDNTGKPKYDILGEYTEFTSVLAKAILPHLKILKKASIKTDDKLDKIDNYDPENDTPGEDSVDDSTAEDDVPEDDTGDTPPEDNTGDTPPEDDAALITGEDI